MCDKQVATASATGMQLKGSVQFRQCSRS